MRLLVLLSLTAITACGRTATNEPVYHETTEANELRGVIQRLQDELNHNEIEINRLTTYIEREADPESVFIYDLTIECIRNSLVANVDALTNEINQLVGYPAGDWFRESVLSYTEYIIIRDSDVLVKHRIWLPIMLFYYGMNLPTIDGEAVPLYEGIDWDLIEWITEIHWQVVAYGDSWYGASLMRLVQPPPTRRHLTDLNTVTIRFDDVWYIDTYTYVEIPGAYLWEEAIRLAHYYYGVQVRDLWYEGSILYVDLFPITGRLNVGLGSIIMAERLREAFERFPHQDAVRFLVGGERPFPNIGYLGFDINCVPPCPVWGTWGMGSPYWCICYWE
ncbi:MAG: hypothetical protein FWC73_08805 [Defluviitaleaceae bacterium]|nr:hypothetical protein [Defluviitaleaceae bacterium]